MPDWPRVAAETLPERIDAALHLLA